MPKQSLHAKKRRIEKVGLPVTVVYRLQLFLQPFMLTEMLKWNKGYSILEYQYF